jgi:hypothetical protein
MNANLANRFHYELGYGARASPGVSTIAMRQKAIAPVRASMKPEHEAPRFTRQTARTTAANDSRVQEQRVLIMLKTLLLALPALLFISLLVYLERTEPGHTKPSKAKARRYGSARGGH